MAAECTTNPCSRTWESESAFSLFPPGMKLQHEVRNVLFSRKHVFISTEKHWFLILTSNEREKNFRYLLTWFLSVFDDNPSFLSPWFSSFLFRVLLALLNNDNGRPDWIRVALRQQAADLALSGRSSIFRYFEQHTDLETAAFPFPINTLFFFPSIYVRAPPYRGSSIFYLLGKDAFLLCMLEYKGGRRERERAPPT